ncbi:glycosyltransferase family 4 protein [Sphingobium sp.]|uniref:glycosyltransferase family 4 protein n=1 Tax=Sphingobium sp. TaxID=1912891 RepID=UPI003BB7F50C
MARILINHYTAVPNKITGITVYSFAIAEALVRHGRHDYVFVTDWDIDRLPPQIVSLPCEIIGRRAVKNETLELFEAARRLPALKRQTNSDLIFHTGPTSMWGGYDRSVVVIHDMYRVTSPALYSLAQRLQWHHFTARTFRRAAAIIAVSDATARDVRAAYRETPPRVSVVHEAPPIGPANVSPVRPIERPYALMVANLSPNKNVRVVVDALKLLADRGECPTVCLVGRDPGGALAAMLDGRTDIDMVRVEGVSDAELSAYYAHARMFINTSLMEGFCLPVLEAQAFGTPVICSDLPVLREVAGEGALFVDPRNPSRVAEAIMLVAGNDAVRDDLAERSITNVQRFSWEKAARETEAVFDTVLASQATS